MVKHHPEYDSRDGLPFCSSVWSCSNQDQPVDLYMKSGLQRAALSAIFESGGGSYITAYSINLCKSPLCFISEQTSPLTNTNVLV